MSKKTVTTDKPVIAVSDLSKKYTTSDITTVALEQVSFEIYPGEFVAIMGPSGSGKSTLMHILGALDTPTSGEYYLDGQALGSLSDDQLSEIRNQKIGFIFQAFNLLPRISAVQNVALPLFYAGVNKDTRTALATSYLEKVGLGHRLQHTSAMTLPIPITMPSTANPLRSLLTTSVPAASKNNS